MTKKVIKAIEDSIAHWERMRAWMREQPKYREFNQNEIQELLGEGMDSKDCALCQLFECDCKKCILAKKTDECGESKNAYMKVYKSKTYGEAAKNSIKMIRQLKSLLPKEK